MCKMTQCNNNHSQVVHQCAGSRQQVERFKQPRPHANSLSTKLAVPDSNTPSSRRTFLCHWGRAGGSGRAGMLPSHYWTERDSMWRHRWDESLTKAFLFSGFLKLPSIRQGWQNIGFSKVFGSSRLTEDKIFSDTQLLFIRMKWSSRWKIFSAPKYLLCGIINLISVDIPLINMPAVKQIRGLARLLSLDRSWPVESSWL